MCRLRLLDLAAAAHHDLEGRYVVSYDPEYHLPDGTYDGGKLETSHDVKDAMVFASIGDAFGFWKSGPSCRCHMVRMDGKPNRPLTAFNMEIVQ